MGESENLQANPVHITMDKESIPHQSSANGELCAVSLKAANITSDNQPQQIPSAEIDTDEKESLRQYNMTTGSDEINENNNKVDDEVSVLNSKGKYLCMFSKISFAYTF